MTRREAIQRTSFILGYAVSAASIAGFMSGCKAETTGLDWQPVFFTKEQGATVAEFAERILPKTDTPGAKDVGVHEFIDAMVGEFYEPEEKEAFMKGLAGLEERCQKEYSKSFVDCSTEQQDALLSNLQSETLANKDKGRTFFSRLHELTFLGYFQSEEVGTNVLTYNPIPGPYQGCIPVEDVGNAWSLS
jgi:hypothetical protein